LPAELEDRSVATSSPSPPTDEADDRPVASSRASIDPGSVVELDLLRRLAIDTAQHAGEVLGRAAMRLAAGDDLGVSTKSSVTDPVSEADRSAERLIASRLLEARPDDGLVGEEEQDPQESTSGLTWIVDPLDGTVNFLYGAPTWSVSIACVDDRGGLVGVVHDPTRGETFHAVRGGGAWLRGPDGDDRRLRCTAASDLGATLVATGFAYDPAVRAEQAQDLLMLLPRIRDVRRGGSAALDLCWCAAGRVDATLEFGLSPWDWAAGALMVLEAGGRVSHPRRTYVGREIAGVLAGGHAAHDHLAGWLETTR
jgi:myo-inositol-1(or 4)-monophosphatase